MSNVWITTEDMAGLDTSVRVWAKDFAIRLLTISCDERCEKMDDEEFKKYLSATHAVELMAPAWAEREKQRTLEVKSENSDPNS